MPNLCGIPDFEHTISSVEACYVILYHCVILIFVIVLLNKMWVVTRSMSMPSRSDVEPKCWQNLPSHVDAIVKSDLGLQLPSAMQAPTQTISLVQHAGPEGPVGGRLPGFRHSKCYCCVMLNCGGNSRFAPFLFRCNAPISLVELPYFASGQIHQRFQHYFDPAHAANI